MHTASSITDFVWLGFTHVIPKGFDHILFILCIYFMKERLKEVIILCSAFTIAHSISLGLAAAGIITVSKTITEPLIALSILITAIRNIMSKDESKWQLPVILLFGLVHGLGFATALEETGLPDNRFLISLFSFNVGVELGQLCIILAAWFFIGKWWAEKPWYKEKVVYPFSSVTACIALYWTIERLLLA